MPAAKGTRLVKHANGVWYLKGPGLGKGKTTRTRDRGEAEMVLANWILTRDRADGTAPVHGLTWEQAVHDYLDEHARPNISAWKQAELATDIFLAWLPPNRLIVDTKESDIRAYQTARRQGGLRRFKDDPPLKPAGDGTIIREMGVLSAVMHHAARNDRLPKAALPNIPVPRQPPPRQRWLTSDEEMRLLEACGPQDGFCEPAPFVAESDYGKPRRLSRIYRFLMLAMHTAARREAIETLTWDQVDMRNKTIDLNPRGRAQTKKRRPVISMSSDLFAMLERAFRERTGADVLDHQGSIRTAYETVRERAGIPDVSPHIHRHTWATRAARNGVPMREVADFLGDDLRTVEKVYYKHSPEYLKAARDWREVEKERERNYG